MNVARVALALLRQNRWIVALLGLWPVAMMLVLLVPGTRPGKDDVASVLHQECFYVLALITVMTASILGTEQRSRRSVFVLARAVSRTHYLLSVIVTALAASSVFTACFLLCGVVLLHQSGGHFAAVIAMAALELLLCVWFATVAALFSVFLPGLLASLAVSIAAGAIFLVGRQVAFSESLLGLSRVIPDLLAISLDLAHPAAAVSFEASVSILMQAGGAFWLATFLFIRRDLQMTEN